MRTHATASVFVRSDVDLNVSEHGGGYASVSLDLGMACLMFTDAATAERLAQALLDAANMLRDKADPPATIQRVEDTPSPSADEVTRRLSPWTAAPVLGTAGDLTGEPAAAGVAR